MLCLSYFNSFHLSDYLFIFFSLEVDPLGAQEKVLEIARSLGLNVSVGVAHEVTVSSAGNSQYFVKSTVNYKNSIRYSDHKVTKYYFKITELLLLFF